MPEAACENTAEEAEAKEAAEAKKQADTEAAAEEAGSEAEETAEEQGDTEETPENPEEAEDPEDEAKDYFKKKKKEKKDKKDELLAELTDKLQRQMAEFENFRKRTDKEKATMYDMGIRDMAEKLLPVIDNFERGLAGADDSDPFAEGMKMIYKQMMTMLEGLGITPIEAAGKEFDPNLHNAVMHVDDENYGENIVAEELQKGYMYKDHVVRHSMVKVAN
ncbi:MAG: nucleotide exchange factor GrpE [Eubacterium sp.]|nr:nucleotide exchange factor GrpE [Eubacterium sp.]